MKVLDFGTGQGIVECEGRFYFDGNHNHTMYSAHFEQYQLLAGYVKQADVSEVQGFTLSDIDNLDYLLLESTNIKKDVIVHRWKLKTQLKAVISQCDCVVIYSPAVLNGLALSVIRKLKKPYIIKVGGCARDNAWTRGITGKLVAPFVFFLTRRQIKRAPYVIYVTREFLQKKYPTRGVAGSFSGVVLKDIDEDILTRRLDSIEKKGNAPFIIGTTAFTYLRYKGQQYVIKALAKLKEQGYANFVYQLVGLGDQSYLRGVAKKYGVENQVLFLGSMPHDKMFDWLDTIDIYAQPSRTEGLPRALIEAMSRGLPAIGARTGGIPELLQPEFIFSNSRREIDEIVKLLTELQSPQLRMDQARRNFEEAKKYRKEVMDERSREFFERFKREVDIGKALAKTGYIYGKAKV